MNQYSCSGLLVALWPFHNSYCHSNWPQTVALSEDCHHTKLEIYQFMYILTPTNDRFLHTLIYLTMTLHMWSNTTDMNKGHNPPSPWEKKETIQPLLTIKSILRMLPNTKTSLLWCSIGVQKVTHLFIVDFQHAECDLKFSFTALCFLPLNPLENGFAELWHHPWKWQG